MTSCWIRICSELESDLVFLVSGPSLPGGIDPDPFFSSDPDPVSINPEPQLCQKHTNDSRFQPDIRVRQGASYSNA